ncbi:MAG: MBL fold metallo-hydrolase [Clostridia bacterium]|nr:MBL fold metallo-hydrolase [Clostridia bacterium]MBO7319849.1 MBL fold metallo-hydrolase [Clostridia bacterium]
MFDIVETLGNTYYYSAFSNVGVYKLNRSEVLLIDSCDHKRMVKSLDGILEKNGLRVKTIIDTHCHVDHIAGNKFFYDKYGCEILASKGEQGFIAYPDREPRFYYSGINTDKTRNPFFITEPSDATVITAKNTPEGFEIIPLPGHSFDMIGVRTPDDVVFLADAILSKKTWDEYKLPFFYSVNESLQTLKDIQNIKAKLFVPAHDEPLSDICELAEYNIESMKHKKELIYSLCSGKSFEEIFALAIDKLDLRIMTPKYPMYSVMVRNFLQSLVEDEAINTTLEDSVLIYRRV